MIYVIEDKPLLERDKTFKYSTIEDCKKWLEDKKEIALDIETEGLFNHSNKIVMLILSDGNDTYIIDTRTTNFITLKEPLENILILGSNLKFDYKFLKKYGIRLNNIYDCFLAEILLTNGLKVSRSLDFMCLKYLNVKLDKSVTLEFTRLNGKAFTNKQIIYGVQDAVNLFKIRELQMQEINKLELNNALDLENKACLALADIEYNGLGFNKEPWVNLAEKVKKNLIVLSSELDEIVSKEPKLKSFIKPYEQLKMFDLVDRKIAIDWNSPTQVLKVFKTLGLDITSTEEKDISKFQNEYVLIKKFIDYKKESKLDSTYGLNFLDNINPVTHRIHTDFWQIKETNRVSSKEPNLQNLPAKNDYLNCFIAEKGFKFIGIDYVGQEAKVAACGSKDDVWLNTFKEGKDLHSEVCKMMFNITDDLVRTKPDFLRGKTYRDAAKTINFGVLFGMSKFKLSNTLQITIDEAEELIKKYFKASPKLKAYLDSCANYGLKNGYIRSYKPYSVVRYFPNWSPDLDPKKDFKVVGEITRVSYNSPVQSTGALITKLALHKIRDYIYKNNLEDKVKLIHVVHDAIYTEVIEEIAEEFAEIQALLMEQAGKEFNLELPMTTDISINSYWNK